jgi:hypothetical protein
VQIFYHIIQAGFSIIIGVRKCNIRSYSRDAPSTIGHQPVGKKEYIQPIGNQEHIQPIVNKEYIQPIGNKDYEVR